MAVRTYRGYFAARACVKVLEQIEDEYNALDDDPMTAYYGAGDVVADSYQRACNRVAHHFGFTCPEQAWDTAFRDHR